ncbi:lachesin-like [Watersipora subatra]|uniref:lachesin-like n=1 Tax=Watersipora subatra TaxID=2589382 RepID=UPI00355C1AF5
MRFRSILVFVCYSWALFTYAGVSGQSTGRITQQAEEVVRSAGASGTLNCTVTGPVGSQDFEIVEWVFLNNSGGPKTVSRDCIIEEEDERSAIEKYLIVCEELQTTSIKYSLTINMLSQQDNGWYECRVRLSNVLLPVDTMHVKMTVLSPPTIQESATPLVIDAYINQTIQLPCSAEGVPAPNVTWGRGNGKPLPPVRSSSTRNKTSDIITNETLTIRNVIKEDAGIYRCSADNNIRPPDDFYSRVSVQYKPTVSRVEQSYGTPTGENTQVMIWCKVEGNPRPSMMWYKMSFEQTESFDRGEFELDEQFFSQASVISSDRKYKVEQKVMIIGSLSTMESMFYTLTLLTVEPGDMVYYVCKAENKHGTDATDVLLYRITTLADENSKSSVTTNSWMVLSICLIGSLLRFNH